MKYSLSKKHIILILFLFFSTTVTLSIRNNETLCVEFCKKIINTSVRKGVNPLNYKIFLYFIQIMDGDSQRKIWKELSIDYNEILEPFYNSPTPPSSTPNFAEQHETYKRNLKLFHGTHLMSVGEYKRIRDDFAEHYVNTPGFNCDIHVKPFIDEMIHDEFNHSKRNFIGRLFIELGRQFSENPEYIDFIFPYIKSTQPELIYEAESTLLAYYYQSPEGSYKKYRDIVLYSQDHTDFPLTSYIKGTTETEKISYIKGSSRRSEKMLDMIDGFIPRYDSSYSSLRYIE